MAPSKWDDEEDSSTPPSSPPAPATTARRSKFDDEEDDSDVRDRTFYYTPQTTNRISRQQVVDSWDKAEDSEEERQKAQVAAAARQKAEAEARANKKSKGQRIEEKRMESMKKRQEEEDESSEESEDETEKRARLRREQKESDLKHAEELFGGAGAGKDRPREKPVTIKDPHDPSKSLELSSLSIFNPSTRDQFTQLRETLTPLITANQKMASYTSFATEFSKGITKDLSSEQIKKIASALTTLSNEKMKEEKAAEKGGKKSKAAKSKTTLNASRNVSQNADTTAYDDGLEEDDFM